MRPFADVSIMLKGSESRRSGAAIVSSNCHQRPDPCPGWAHGPSRNSPVSSATLMRDPDLRPQARDHAGVSNQQLSTQFGNGRLRLTSSTKLAHGLRLRTCHVPPDCAQNNMAHCAYLNKRNERSPSVSGGPWQSQ